MYINFLNETMYYFNLYNLKEEDIVEVTCLKNNSRQKISWLQLKDFMKAFYNNEVKYFKGNPKYEVDPTLQINFKNGKLSRCIKNGIEQWEFLKV